MWQDTLWAFESYPIFYYVCVFFFSISIGSFLNVIIYRLPVIMERNWKFDCQEFLGLQTDTSETFNLMTPASTCPHCKSAIKPWHNIPIFAWLYLHGKCANCNATISIQYPLIELTTGLLSLLVAFQFGVSIQTICGLLFVWTLITLSVIDYKTTYLPDHLTLPLLWFGLVLSLWDVYTDAHSAIIGAVAGYLIFWSVFWVFKLITNKDGMGGGDFKLLAALGAWMGWQALPQIILISSLLGVFGALIMAVSGQTIQNRQIPFGPYLAIAGFLMLLWGEQIITTYNFVFA